VVFKVSIFGCGWRGRGIGTWFPSAPGLELDGFLSFELAVFDFQPVAGFSAADVRTLLILGQEAFDSSFLRQAEEFPAVLFDVVNVDDIGQLPDEFLEACLATYQG
jgi:hypothetical protein